MGGDCWCLGFGFLGFRLWGFGFRVRGFLESRFADSGLQGVETSRHDKDANSQTSVATS